LVDPPTFTMAAAIGTAYNSALQDWHRTHAPSERIIDLFAGPLAAVVVESCIMARGVLNITIVCHGRRKHEDETFFYRFHRRGPDDWTFTGGSIDL
jgi:hypothetical protein